MNAQTGTKPHCTRRIRLLSVGCVGQTQARSSGGKACWARRHRAEGFVTERCFFTVCSPPLSTSRWWKCERRTGPRKEAGKKKLSANGSKQRLQPLSPRWDARDSKPSHMTWETVFVINLGAGLLTQTQSGCWAGDGTHSIFFIIVIICILTYGESNS